MIFMLMGKINRNMDKLKMDFTCNILWLIQQSFRNKNKCHIDIHILTNLLPFGIIKDKNNMQQLILFS